MTQPAYSAYVPCFNNVATLEQSIRSILSQSIKPTEVWVIDDGSNDATSEILNGSLKESLKIIRHASNQGRGTARARAMQECNTELVLCCDATNILEPEFAEKAMKWFNKPDTGSVHGKLMQQPGGNAAQRWRGRHLFRENDAQLVNEKATLSTWGAMVRKSAVMSIGNYSPACRHSEDAELGMRLNKAGFKTIFDPSLSLYSISKNSVGQVLERYWRWYAGPEEKVSIKDYLKNVVYSAKVMAAKDLRKGDPGACLISLLCPHYQFWKAAWRTTTGKNQRSG